MDLKPAERLQRAKVAAVNHGLKRIVFVSELFRRSFLESVPLRRELTIVIPNGIDARRFSPTGGDSFRAEFGIGADEFVVGVVATPGRPAKGLDILLSAASILKTTAPRYRFLIVGDLDLGRGTALLNDRESRGLTKDVIITGFRNDVDRALASFDVYALTSRTEGFPLSLLEAMASGLPIVATRCGGPQEILDDGITGLLVENGSIEEIAGSIARLRADEALRRRLGAAARTAVNERFTVDAQVRAYEKVYEDSLSPPQRVASGEETKRAHATGV